MDYEVKIKRLSASRRLRLRVLENGEVVVTAPKRIAEQTISAFVDSNRGWIEEKLSIVESKRTSLTEQRERLFYRGKEYDFRLEVATNKKPGVKLEKGTITVTSHSEDHEQVRHVLEKWYRSEAKKRFVARVMLLADLVDKEIKRVSIRDQRTRWGSCSSRQTISLNWRLIMTPDFVSDYIIYHELAHLTHMNHSDRFWRLVEEYCPAYRDAEKWLKSHQQLLSF